MTSWEERGLQVGWRSAGRVEKGMQTYYHGKQEGLGGVLERDKGRGG